MVFYIKHSLLLLSICFFSYRAYAIETILLHDSRDEYAISPANTTVLEDTICNYHVEEVRKSIDRFSDKPFYAQSPEACYWLTFTYACKKDSPEKWVLEVQALHTQQIEVYTITDEGRSKPLTTGQHYPFRQREYAVKNLIFDLPYSTDTQRILIKIRTKNYAGFDYIIRSQSYFTAYTANEYYFLGLFYGILFIMGIYNLILFFNSKEKVFLLYVLYVISCVLITASEDGLGFQYLWNDHPQWNTPIDFYVAPLLFLLSFLVYSLSFLDLRNRFPDVFKWVVIISGIYIIYFFLEIWILPESLQSSKPYIIPFIAIYTAAIYSYVNGYRASRFFILGYTFVFISIIVNQLRINGFIPHTIFTVYSFNFGILLEVVVLSYALADRFRLLKSEKEQAQQKTIEAYKERERLKNMLIKELKEKEQLKDKVNRELEEKVAERTSELSDANAKLKALTDELNKMASQLDKDNWQLQKEIKEKEKTLILSKNVSYEDFKRLFPDNQSCLEYLKGIKWNDQFTCQKCGNTKYTTRSNGARKCTRCNHIESIIANTLFHGVKFPLNKAFFIAFTVYNNNKTYTIEDLSSLLHITQTTCWKFRKRVEERLKKQPESSSWEDIII